MNELVRNCAREAYHGPEVFMQTIEVGELVLLVASGNMKARLAKHADAAERILENRSPDFYAGNVVGYLFVWQQAPSGSEERNIFEACLGRLSEVMQVVQTPIAPPSAELLLVQEFVDRCQLVLPESTAANILMVIPTKQSEEYYIGLAYALHRACEVAQQQKNATAELIYMGYLVVVATLLPGRLD
jgi:hypothetical protein